MHPHPSRFPSQVTSRFFWGVHSGVGGGLTDQRLNADITLRFVIDELSRRGCGLCFDAALIPTAYHGDKDAAVMAKDGEEERKKTSLMTRIMKFVGGTGYRLVESVEDVHWSAIKQFQTNKEWRPPALNKIEAELMKCDWKRKKDEEVAAGHVMSEQVGSVYKVVKY